jgi:hypothetical protein
MRLNTRQRWTIYGLAATVTLAAMVWVDRQPSGEAQAPVVALSQRAASAAEATGASRTDTVLAARLPGPRRFSTPGGELFGTPEWEQSRLARAAAAAAAAQAPRVVVSRQKPSAPPVPYAYLGRWVENGKTQVYFSAGGRDHRVAVGDKLGSDYRLKSIDERQAVFEYLPLGVLQTVSLGAAPTVAAQAPVRTNAAADSISESSESN